MTDMPETLRRCRNAQCAEKSAGRFCPRCGTQMRDRSSPVVALAIVLPIIAVVLLLGLLVARVSVSPSMAPTSTTIVRR